MDYVDRNRRIRSPGLEKLSLNGRDEAVAHGAILTKTVIVG